MPGTFSQLYSHIVFSTKHREPEITPSIRDRLYPYIGGIVRAEKCSLLAVGGMPDHVHLLVRYRPTTVFSDFMRTVKARSSVWVHEEFQDRHDFAWQEGYAAFSVSTSVVPEVRQYIENQEAHHATRDFKEELLALLRENGVEFDPRYVFD